MTPPKNLAALKNDVQLQFPDMKDVSKSNLVLTKDTVYIA